MSKALLRNIRLSPTKARLVAREVQGMNAELALASLEFTPNKAARVIYKVIASAVANGSYDAKEVIITSCRVDAGAVLRRFTPRARGRATPIRKPMSHIFVEVGTQKSQEKQKQQAKTKNNDKVVSKETQQSAKTSTTQPQATKTSATAKPKTKESTQVESKSKTTQTKPKATKANVQSSVDSAKPKQTKPKANKKTEGEGK
ncbi:50S ribosomal protein L22 [Helicobacter sp. 23-1046]